MRNLNLNNTYYETRDKNFNEALKLLEKEFSHSELILMLKTGNIPQKQFAALQINTITSKEDAMTLLKNLTGQDGKVREAVSLKIKELVSNTDYFIFFNSIDVNELSEIFLAAIIDIIGNICRNILDTVVYFRDNDNFINLFTEKLINLIFTLLDKVKDFDLQDGKYKINKELFKLYWCLEAVNIYYDKISPDILKKIVNITKSVEEYTIREKTAKILSNPTDDEDLLKIKSELKNDKNYYVRRI